MVLGFTGYAAGTVTFSAITFQNARHSSGNGAWLTDVLFGEATGIGAGSPAGTYGGIPALRA